ncbi:M20 family metallopeptidase [soil metagenome]
MTPDELLTWCRADEPWLLETLEALVRLESPSTSKTAVDRCGVELALGLESIGARVDRLPQAARGDHLRAEFPGTAGGRPVLILGHFDTVWDVGELARMPIREEGGRLHGPGIFDMKAGIAVAMQAMRALAAAGGPPRPDVVMLWTTDEEIGSATSRGIIEEEARRSAAVLVLEPSLPGGAAKTARKGCGDFELTVRGVSAHAGIDPGGGASAIHEMARQVSALERLRDIDPAVSVNVGLIRGGTRPNVVADEAHASIDVRAPTMAAAARVEDAVRGLVPTLRGTTLEITGGFGRPPLERTSQVMRLYEVARDAARELGVELGEGSTGGGSDGNFTAALGVPTLDGLGPMGDGAHARHEHVLRQDLCWRAAFVGLLLTRLAR